MQRPHAVPAPKQGLEELLARGERPVGLYKPCAPLSSRPEPPDEGEFVEILGYRVTRRTKQTDPKKRIFYYAYDANDEIVSFAENWMDWCHQFNWFPRDGLDAGASIPRDERDTTERKPKPRSAPVVLNRHHFRSRDEIPDPWIYMGRGHPLGNPFVVVKDDPEIRSTLEADPSNPEHRSSMDALTRYKRWLWDKICKRDLAVLRELGKITPETNLVCSCAPRPCHLDVVVRAWKWARGRTVLDGYAAMDEAEPEWVGSASPSGPASGEGAQDPESSVRTLLVEPAAPPPEDRPVVQPQNLDLFGEPS
jgi:hypothetical protein